MAQKLLVAALLCSMGCGRIERTRQCRELVKTVNTRLDDIEQQFSSGKRDPATFDEIAAKYDRLAATLSKLHFSDAALQAAASEYGDIVRETATRTRSLVAGLKVQDQTRIAKERVELERLNRRQHLEVLKMDGRCRAP